MKGSANLGRADYDRSDFWGQAHSRLNCVSKLRQNRAEQSKVISFEMNGYEKGSFSCHERATGTDRREIPYDLCSSSRLQQVKHRGVTSNNRGGQLTLTRLLCQRNDSICVENLCIKGLSGSEKIIEIHHVLLFFLVVLRC